MSQVPSSFYTEGLWGMTLGYHISQLSLVLQLPPQSSYLLSKLVPILVLLGKKGHDSLKQSLRVSALGAFLMLTQYFCITTFSSHVSRSSHLWEWIHLPRPWGLSSVWHPTSHLALMPLVIVNRAQLVNLRSPLGPGICLLFWHLPKLAWSSEQLFPISVLTKI